MSAPTPNRLTPNLGKSAPQAAQRVPPQPKPLHNELWSVRALAQQHLQSVAYGDRPLTIEAGEARLLLSTLVALIADGQPRIADMKTAAQAAVQKAMDEAHNKLMQKVEG